MTTRIGKIGRLPKSIREELGRRIENGVPGTEIVQWLNAQAEVQGVLAKYFEGRPVNEQNLSDWKQSGHGDWVRRQEARAWAGGMSEQAEELDEAAGDRDLSDALATVLAMEIGQLQSELLTGCTEAKERWARLRELNQELSRLRRDADRRERTWNQRERWQWQIDRQEAMDEQQQEQARREERLSRYSDRMDMKDMAELFGQRAAERLYRMKYGLPEDDLNDGTWEAKEAARQEKIRQRKVEQNRMEEGKVGNGKHPTTNSRTSASQEHPTSKEKPEPKEQPRPNVGLAKGTKAGGKIKTEKLADRKMGVEGQMTNDELVELPQAEEKSTGWGQPAYRGESGAVDHTAGDEPGNAPGRETGAPGTKQGNAPYREAGAPRAVNPGESRLIKGCASEAGWNAGESPARRIGLFTTEHDLNSAAARRGWKLRKMSRRAVMKMNHLQ